MSTESPNLDDLHAVLPELAAVCHQLSELFSSDTPEEGFAPLRELARIWEHVKVQQSAAAQSLGVSLNEMTVDNQSVASHHESLNRHLAAAAAAIEKNDAVILSDLLEYELAPLAEREVQIVELLQQQCNTGQ